MWTGRSNRSPLEGAKPVGAVPEVHGVVGLRGPRSPPGRGAVVVAVIPSGAWVASRGLDNRLGRVPWSGGEQKRAHLLTRVCMAGRVGQFMP